MWNLGEEKCPAYPRQANFALSSGKFSSTVRAKHACLQRLSNIEDIYYSVISQIKILSLVLNTKEKIFHFASISV